jgi:predicted O-linked N-acetylglucosamine transferase (SPINDLY family)
VDIAAKLAGDPDRLTALRSGMRQRMTNSPLLDSKNFAAAVEAAYRSMWQRYLGI